jgi:hypothetical protein
VTAVRQTSSLQRTKAVVTTVKIERILTHLERPAGEGDVLVPFAAPVVPASSNSHFPHAFLSEVLGSVVATHERDKEEASSCISASAMS